MTRDAGRCCRRGEPGIHLVDPEMVELGQDAREIGAVALHVAPPGRALDARTVQHLGYARARVPVDRLVGHLEVETGRDAILHAAPYDSAESGPGAGTG